MKSALINPLSFARFLIPYYSYIAMFHYESLEKILKNNRKQQQKSLSEERDNVLFLDYDGVINIDPYNFGNKPYDEHCMANVNRLCKEFNLKIVVSSSWKNYPDYQSRLYVSGLDESITILGKTDTFGFREEEIKEYIKEHIHINKFIVLDDARLDELTPYHVRTKFHEGFNDQKYEEARKLLINQ